MTQLDLFASEPPEKKPDADYLPYFMKTIGGGNYDDFLQLYRDYDNTMVSISSSEIVTTRIINKKRIPIYRIFTQQYRLSSFSSIDDIPTIKRLLYTFDPDTKEWEHKAVNNFRINSLLHNIYDYFNELKNV